MYTNPDHSQFKMHSMGHIAAIEKMIGTVLWFLFMRGWLYQLATHTFYSCFGLSRFLRQD